MTPTTTQCRATVPSPIGDLLLEGDDEALTHLYLPGRWPLDPLPGGAPPSRPLIDATAQLREYFAGRRRSFDVAVRLEGTPFQRQVWSALAGIPYGETISYGELAARVERPRGFRAVGQANGANPVAIVFPCHRVIAADGTIGGYGGGVDAKRTLLALERRRAKAGSPAPWRAQKGAGRQEAGTAPRIHSSPATSARRWS